MNQMINQMIHFHTHSEYSFDGFDSVQDIFKKCKATNKPSIAITDHNSLFSWFDMVDCALEHQVKPIFGVEMNVGDHHIVAVALNDAGLENIIRLNNKAYAKNESPRVTEKELYEHKEGVYFLSGCSKGKIPSLVKKRKMDCAIQKVAEYKEAFGECFAIEIQRYSKHNDNLIKNMLQLAKNASVDIIPTNDIHFLNKEDFHAYQVYVKIMTSDKFRVMNDECFFKTDEEMEHMFPGKMLDQTFLLHEKCKANFYSFMKQQNGEERIPITKIHRYDDASSIKMVLFREKKHALGEFLYNKMKKESMVLDDLYDEGVLNREIKIAKKISGRISRIEKHPYLLIETNELYPYFKKSGKDERIAQIEEHTARKLDMELFDERKKIVYM